VRSSGILIGFIIGLVFVCVAGLILAVTGNAEGGIIGTLGGGIALLLGIGATGSSRQKPSRNQGNDGSGENLGSAGRTIEAVSSELSSVAAEVGGVAAGLVRGSEPTTPAGSRLRARATDIEDDKLQPGSGERRGDSLGHN
jgi:hypothetical protein